MKQYGRVDYVLTSVTMMLISTPTFVLGLILIYILGVSLRLLPIGGMQTLGKPFSIAGPRRPLVMPALILGFAYAAPLMRYTRVEHARGPRQRVRHDGPREGPDVRTSSSSATASATP